MKKRIALILGGVLIVAVLAALLCFILFTGGSASEVTVDWDGTWVVYQYSENLVDNEYMVFENGVLSDYRDGNSDPFITSSYEFDNGTLTLPEISREFAVRVVSENNVILIEPDTREWKLIRVSGIQPVTTADVAGEYDVVRRAGEQISNETMVFTETGFTDYRDGEQYLACDYELVSDHLLRAADISKEFYIYKNGTFLMLVDLDGGHVWELQRK